jgi:alanine racemase
MIRPGAILYGMKGFHYGTLDLKQALRFKTKRLPRVYIKDNEIVNVINYIG